MRIEPAVAVVGHVAVPGDKSISHRAVLIGAVAEADTCVRGFGRAGDTQASLNAVRALGVEVEDVADDELLVHGGELRSGAIDCENAGTLMRLLAGSARRQAGALRAHRRRVAVRAADGARRRAAAAHGGHDRDRPTGTRRS